MLREIFNPQNYAFQFTNYYALSGFYNSAIAFLFSWFVYSKNRENAVNITYGIFGFFTGIWCLGYFLWQVSVPEQVALFWSRGLMAGAIFITVAYYHFIVKWLGLFEKKKQSIVVGYLVFFLFFILNFTSLFVQKVRPIMDFKFYPKAGILFTPFLAIWFFYALYALYLLLQKYKISNGNVKNQAKLILTGMAFAYFGGSTNYFLFYDIKIFPFGNYFCVLVYMSLTAYAIIRYRAMEIDTVIHRTLLWILTSSLIFVPIGVVVYLIHPRLADLTWISLTFLAALLVYVYLYSYPKIQPKIDHVFRRRKYDYYAVLEELGQKIGSELELEKVGHRIFKELKEILYIRSGVLLAQKPGQEDYEEIGSLSGKGIADPSRQASKSLLSLPFSSKLSQYLSREQKALEREQVEADPQYQEIKEEGLAWLKQKEIEVLIPIVLEGKVNGLLGIGKKENLQGYTQKDIELLEKMGKQLGVTIDNALHHEDIVEKGRLAEEMKLGREIQMNLLPKEAPQVEGLKITGLMIPAKEIGGDYYDYIVTSSKNSDTVISGKVVKEEQENDITVPLYHSTTDRLAIIIGDVSGKGVAAGLIMATAKATLKGLSEQGLSPRQMLSKANSLLHEYTKGEKFMTMLYLTWDNQHKKLNYSSAGHEHIIIYRSGKVVEAQQEDSASGKEVENSVSVVSGKVVKGISEQKDITTVPLYPSTTGSVEVILSGGLVLGMLPEIGEMLEDRSIQLNIGDKVILYTDGVTEAHNPQEELYSLERLTAAVQRHGHKPAEELLEAVRQEVYGFISTQDQYDDITLVGMEAV